MLSRWTCMLDVCLCVCIVGSVQQVHIQQKLEYREFISQFYLEQVVSEIRKRIRNLNSEIEQHEDQRVHIYVCMCTYTYAIEIRISLNHISALPSTSSVWKYRQESETSTQKLNSMKISRVPLIIKTLLKGCWSDTFEFQDSTVQVR